MSKKNYKKSYEKKSVSRKNRKKGTSSSNLLNFAKMLGQVERGCKNPDSRIFEAYDSGLNKTKRKKKSLF